MAKTGGGYLRGPWWRHTGDDETETRRCYVIAWGPVVVSPDDTYRQGVRSVRFAIKTGRGAGRKEVHLVCVAYGERLSAVIMRAQERGDFVFAAGTWSEHLKAKTKKGIKTTYEMRVNFIIPFELIGFLMDLYATPEIQAVVDEHQNEEADVWESDD